MQDDFGKQLSKYQKVNQDTINEFQCLLFDSLNSTTTNESIVGNPKFRKTFEFSIDHENGLKMTTLEGKTAYPHFIRGIFFAIKHQSSEELLSSSKSEIDAVWKCFVDTEGQQQPFMTVCSDVQHGRIRKIFGL